MLKWYRIYKSKAKNKSERLDVNKLKDQEIRTNYEEGVFQNIDNKNDSDISWKNIVDAVTEAGEKVLGKRSRNETKKYSNEKIDILSKKQKDLRLLIETWDDIERYAVLKKERNGIIKQIKKEIKLEKEKEQELIIENIESQKDDSRRMFAAVREIQKKRGNTILVEGPDGYVNSTEQTVKIITDYFEKIFKQDSVTDIPDIKPHKLKTFIDITEVKSAIRKLKENKNPGCDNVQIE